MKITVKIFQSGQEFIANCPELDINCYGPSKHTAVQRLIRVLQFYIDAAKEFGLDVERLDSVTVDGEQYIGLPESEPTAQKSTLMN
ncbi:MAG TPA: hypothetical protein PK544_04200 [Spirochaetota bacterium]|nr:hypothetical protein [Spirochaetota bacterium]HPJ38686.1 hypothetical protein [Spirochaetota bacterium]HPQ53641.1 hypothetical protein [Spirochaetota bacterium]